MHDGELQELHAGKISTGQGALLAELTPTRKIISELRAWFPQSKITGWKFEVDGDKTLVLRKANEQLTTCRTDACVVNGPAYGPGFGIVTNGTPGALHLESREQLFVALEKHLGS